MNEQVVSSRCRSNRIRSFGSSSVSAPLARLTSRVIGSIVAKHLCKNFKTETFVRVNCAGTNWMPSQRGRPLQGRPIAPWCRITQPRNLPVLRAYRRELARWRASRNNDSPRQLRNTQNGPFRERASAAPLNVAVPMDQSRCPISYGPSTLPRRFSLSSRKNSINRRVKAFSGLVSGHTA